MFGNKKGKGTPLLETQEKFDTLIGRHTEIHGTLVVRESVRIDGRLIGNVETPGDQPMTVVVSPSGEVEGDILAHRVVVAGKVTGHIHAIERVELHSGSLIQGDIKYGSIAVEHGARILGLLLQVESVEQANKSDREAQEAIRRVQGA